MIGDEDDSIEAVARRLAAVRKALGMDKASFAAKADLTPQVYGPFENGNRPLTLEAARKLRKAYGLSFEFLFFGNMNDLPHRIATLL